MTFEQEEERFPATENDFRSDTFTVPTKLMKKTIVEFINNEETVLGDSVYKEDETTSGLEEKLRRLSGKESALYCVSGTLSNQIALRANLVQPPYSILCDYRSHVFMHEAGGIATLSQAMVHPVKPINGNYLTFEDIIENVVLDQEDIHAAPTKVISLENTLHGIIMPIEEIIKIFEYAQIHNIKLHLDGARLWNASIETGISIKQYCSYFDSVSLCLSKSLGAPMGSVLVGDARFINKANHFKKQAGGGIRQSGIMTRMAIQAIDENLSKLKKSHYFAKQLGDFCIENNIILESPVDTNFVFIDLKKNQMNSNLLIEIGESYGVKLMGGRISFHFQNDQESVDKIKQTVLECYQDALKNPFKNNFGTKLYNTDAVRKTQHY